MAEFYLRARVPDWSGLFALSLTYARLLLANSRTNQKCLQVSLPTRLLAIFSPMKSLARHSCLKMAFMRMSQYNLNATIR